MLARLLTVLALGAVCAGAFSPSPPPPPPHHFPPPRRLGPFSAQAEARPRSAATLGAQLDAEEGVRLIADLTGVVDERCIPRLAGLLSAAPTPFPAGDEVYGGVRFCCWDDLFEEARDDKPSLLFLQDSTASALAAPRR